MTLTTLSDVEIVALTIWGEARGEPIEGQIAVANVVRNRWTKSSATVAWKAICLAPRQFSCFNGDDPQAARIQRAAVAILSAQVPASLKQALWIAEGVMSGAAQDNTRGATHYLTTALLNSRPPTWAQDQPVLVTIGAHSFLEAA